MIPLGYIALIALNLAAMVASVWDHVDIWAPVANTLLLIVLAEAQRRTGRNVTATHESVHATARTAAEAAEASAAASAAASEACRVAKAIGSSIRHEDPLFVQRLPRSTEETQ